MREVRLVVWTRDYVRRGPVRAPLSVTMEAHWNAASSLSFTIDPQDARALRNYLYQMQEQLQYVLSNLDTENLSEELGAKLRGLQ